MRRPPPESCDHAEFTGASSEAARLFRRVEKVSRILKVDVQGVDNIPSGPALLVANHAFGWDVLFLMSRLRALLGRPVWVLGDHVWWRVPVLRNYATAAGVVDGTPHNLDRLLSDGQLVLVLPGGVREAVKPRELRYRLLWGHRYGFIRAAVRNGAPLVPIAALGADELFDFVGNAYRRGQRWFRQPKLPIPLPSRILPIPHLARFRYRIGESVPVPAPEFEHDTHAIRRLRREVEGAVHELIEFELASRVGIDLS